MILFKHTEVMNFGNAIRGMRNPLNSWDKMDSITCYMDGSCSHCERSEECCSVGLNEVVNFGKNDMKLAKSLRAAGSDHRKYLRQIFVSVDITAPLYWWKEFDTYKIGTVANSCSTMHKIHAKPFSIEDFSTDHMTAPTKNFTATVLVPYLEHIRTWYMENGKKKEDWYDLIQLLPSSYNQMRTVTLNYEVLVNMYHARKHHKLDEWRKLCLWIESLPYAKELIIGE